MNDFAAIGLRIQGEYVRDGTKCQPFNVYVERFKFKNETILSMEFYRFNFLNMKPCGLADLAASTVLDAVSHSLL
jgi:hypothetical protein